MELRNLPTSVAPVVEYFMAHPQSHQGPPMLYQSFSELDHSRLPDVIEGISGPEDMFTEPNEEDSLTFRGRNNRVTTHTTKTQEHHADVMLGLLYLMVGGVDEAHDLVLPYSWPCDTQWGGPAVPDSPSLANAAYAHAILHRYEGKHTGEGSMRGWDNAKFWFSLTPDHHFMFNDIPAQFEELQKRLCQGDRRYLERAKGRGDWNCNSLVDLFSRCGGSTEVTNICNEIHNKEIITLFNHCNDIVNNK